MPLYDYVCKECKHHFEEQLRIANRHIPTESPCVECGGVVEQLIMPTKIGDAVLLGVHKNPPEFIDVIQKIKEDHPLSPLNYTGKADKYQ